MRAIIKALLLLLLTLSTATAWDPPISREVKAERADWIGTGTLGKKSFVETSGDTHLWKIALNVKSTEKGNPTKTLIFFFEQGSGPPSSTHASFVSTVRCPPFPRVKDGEEVRVYLAHSNPALENRYFLAGAQMIEKIGEAKGADATATE